MIEKREKENLAKVFKKIDLDNDGTITKDEIHRFYQTNRHAHSLKLSEAEVKLIFDKMDTNGDGKISFLEFKT
jgi:Ca2+-binding EF-hand superfamily protein